MKITALRIMAIAALSFAFLTGCDGVNSQGATQEPKTDTIAVVDTLPVVKEVVKLHGDPLLNSLARILAGIPLEEGDTLYAMTQTEEWKNHSAELNRMWANSQETLNKVDAIRTNDLGDITARAKNVFYSFSGPDFPFMATFFPKAETYYMMGLERAGSPITAKEFGKKTYEKYQKALLDLLRRSYFITSYMSSDLHNSEIDGTVPIFMVLMARMGYEIISIDFQTLNKDGEWVETEKRSPFVSIRFFHPEENKEKTLYYLCTNLLDTEFDPNVQAMIDKINPDSTVSFVKSCSYCLHYGTFSQIREDILKHSFAVVQDDTGITYRTYVDRGWQTILYGTYTHPIDLFPSSVYQKALNDAYTTRKDIRPLGFRFGYNYKGSSLIVALRPETKSE